MRCNLRRCKLDLMDAQQLERMVALHAEGKSAREIALEPGMPNKTTILKWLSRIEANQGGVQGVSGGVSTPQGVSGLEPVLEASLRRSLVGLRLSPAELLDAKETGQLPPEARLDPWGRVEVSDGEPMWPAYSASGLVQGLKNRYGVARSEGAREAKR